VGGDAEVRAENYEAGLVRLGGALRNDPYCGQAFTARLWRSMKREHL
jgi:hypothetical protein